MSLCCQEISRKTSSGRDPEKRTIYFAIWRIPCWRNWWARRPVLWAAPVVYIFCFLIWNSQWNSWQSYDTSYTGSNCPNYDRESLLCSIGDRNLFVTNPEIQSCILIGLELERKSEKSNISTLLSWNIALSVMPSLYSPYPMFDEAYLISKIATVILRCDLRTL